jgi:peptide deformylase
MNASNFGLNKIITVAPHDWCCSSSQLRHISKPVSGENLDLCAIVNELRSVLQTIKYGAGLSAVQIGIPFRIAVVNITKQSDKGIILIDPVLVAATGRLTARSEGCLSLPNYKGKVRRRENIVVKTFNLDGQEITIKTNGYEAAVIQHELDHMGGLFYWDRMENGQRPEPIVVKKSHEGQI